MATPTKARWQLDGKGAPGKDAQASSFPGIATVTLPSEVKGSFDLAELIGFAWAELSTIARWIVYYGFKQKAADATAKAKGETLTDDERLDVYQSMYDRLQDGTWNMEGIIRVAKAVSKLKDCSDESEMRLLERLELVTAEDVDAELARRKAMAA
jgi:hypothetical protein